MNGWRWIIYEKWLNSTWRTFVLVIPPAREGSNSLSSAQLCLDQSINQAILACNRPWLRGSWWLNLKWHLASLCPLLEGGRLAHPISIRLLLLDSLPLLGLIHFVTSYKQSVIKNSALLIIYSMQIIYQSALESLWRDKAIRGEGGSEAK